MTETTTMMTMTVTATQSSRDEMSMSEMKHFYMHIVKRQNLYTFSVNYCIQLHILYKIFHICVEMNQIAKFNFEIFFLFAFRFCGITLTSILNIQNYSVICLCAVCTNYIYESSSHTDALTQTHTTRSFFFIFFLFFAAESNLPSSAISN